MQYPACGTNISSGSSSDSDNRSKNFNGDINDLGKNSEDNNNNNNSSSNVSSDYNQYYQQHQRQHHKTSSQNLCSSSANYFTTDTTISEYSSNQADDTCSSNAPYSSTDGSDSTQFKSILTPDSSSNSSIDRGLEQQIYGCAAMIDINHNQQQQQQQQPKKYELVVKQDSSHIDHQSTTATISAVDSGQPILEIDSQYNHYNYKISPHESNQVWATGDIGLIVGESLARSSSQLPSNDDDGVQQSIIAASNNHQTYISDHEDLRSLSQCVQQQQQQDFNNNNQEDSSSHDYSIDDHGTITTTTTLFNQTNEEANNYANNNVSQHEQLYSSSTSASSYFATSSYNSITNNNYENHYTTEQEMQQQQQQDNFHQSQHQTNNEQMSKFEHPFGSQLDKSQTQTTQESPSSGNEMTTQLQQQYSTSARIPNYHNQYGIQDDLNSYQQPNETSFGHSQAQTQNHDHQIQWLQPHSTSQHLLSSQQDCNSSLNGNNNHQEHEFITSGCQHKVAQYETSELSLPYNSLQQLTMDCDSYSNPIATGIATNLVNQFEDTNKASSNKSRRGRPRKKSQRSKSKLVIILLYVLSLIKTTNLNLLIII